jgi:uncharacterized Tic20 family protein
MLCNSETSPQPRLNTKEDNDRDSKAFATCPYEVDLEALKSCVTVAQYESQSTECTSRESLARYITYNILMIIAIVLILIPTFVLFVLKNLLIVTVGQMFVDEHFHPICIVPLFIIELQFQSLLQKKLRERMRLRDALKLKLEDLKHMAVFIVGMTLVVRIGLVMVSVIAKRLAFDDRNEYRPIPTFYKHFSRARLTEEMTRAA